MTFGERIVYFREKKNLSQKALADLIGITANRLYYYEKDKRQPDVALIKAIANALEISGDDLLGTAWASEKEIMDDAYSSVALSDLLLPKEKAPASVEAEARETGISEVEKHLGRLLVGFGINPNDLTADQADFLIHIVALIKAYLKK